VAEKRPSWPIRLTDGGDEVLMVSGELDLMGGDVLCQRLLHGPHVAVLDLRQVTFIDAAGLRALEAVSDIILRAPSTVVLRLLELVGMTQAFMVEPEQMADPS